MYHFMSILGFVCVWVERVRPPPGGGRGGGGDLPAVAQECSIDPNVCPFGRSRNAEVVAWELASQSS